MPELLDRFGKAMFSPPGKGYLGCVGLVLILMALFAVVIRGNFGRYFDDGVLVSARVTDIGSKSADYTKVTITRFRGIHSEVPEIVLSTQEYIQLEYEAEGKTFKHEVSIGGPYPTCDSSDVWDKIVSDARGRNIVQVRYPRSNPADCKTVYEIDETIGRAHSDWSCMGAFAILLFSPAMVIFYSCLRTPSEMNTDSPID